MGVEPTPKVETKVGSRRWQVGVGGMVIVVACLGAILWSARSLWEGRDETRNAVSGLRSAGAEERADAARALQKIVGKRTPGYVFPALLLAVRDENAEVRAEAATALALVCVEARNAGVQEVEIRASIAALRALMKDDDAGVRMAAGSALTSVTSPDPKGLAPGTQVSAPPTAELRETIEDLATAIGDRDNRVKSLAMHHLGTIGTIVPISAPPSLINALGDRDAEVRGLAALTLSKFRQGNDPVAAQLLDNLEREEPEVRKSYIRSLEAMKLNESSLPGIIRGLRSPDAETRHVSTILASRLRQGAEAAIPALLECLKEPFDPDRRRPAFPGQPGELIDPGRQAAFALGRVAPRSVHAAVTIAALADVVRSGPPYRRPVAAQALGQFGPAAIETLPDLCREMKRLLDLEAIAKPEDIFESTERREAFVRMIPALGLIAPVDPPSPKVVDTLIAATEIRDEHTRSTAIKALAPYLPFEPKVVDRIQMLKQDRSPVVQSAVFEVLKSKETARP